MKKLLLLFALLAGFTACSTKPANYTVIISLDGSRWDYADYYDMPFFDSLATVGVKARMEPSFPSSTFPNHYTMATGLVPDHHGLLGPGDGRRLRHQQQGRPFRPPLLWRRTHLDYRPEAGRQMRRRILGGLGYCHRPKGE